MDIKIRAGHEQDAGSGRTAVKAGQAVFGLDAEITARSIRFGDDDDAKVGIGGIMNHSPETAMTRIAAYTLAAQIAAAANAAAAAQREGAAR